MGEYVGIRTHDRWVVPGKVVDIRLPFDGDGALSRGNKRGEREGGREKERERDRIGSRP